MWHKHTQATVLSALNSEMNLQDIWNPKAVRWCMRYLHWGLPCRASGAPLAPPALPTPPVPRVWGARTARSAPHPVAAAAVPVSAGLDFQAPLMVTTDHNTGNRMQQIWEQIWEQIWQRCFTHHLFQLPTLRIFSRAAWTPQSQQVEIVEISCFSNIIPRTAQNNPKHPQTITLLYVQDCSCISS